MAAKTWTGLGADENWSTPQNWNGDTVPVTTDSITFDGGTSTKACTIDNLGTWSGGSITAQNAYSSTVTQNVAIVVGAFNWTSDQSDWLMNANFTSAAFSLGSGGDFIASTGAFQCTTLAHSLGLLDLSGATSALTTGNVDMSATTPPGPAGVRIICPTGVWEHRGSWAQAGSASDLIDFDGNGGIIRWTGTVNIILNVPSVDFTTCDHVEITRTVGVSGSVTISAGTLLPLGNNPTILSAGTTVNGTITMSGAVTVNSNSSGSGPGTLTIGSGGTVTAVGGSITSIECIRSSLTVNATATWAGTSSITVTFTSVSSSPNMTFTSTAHTFSTLAVSVAAQFTLAASTTGNLGGNTTVTATIFNVSGTLIGPSTVTASTAFNVNSTGVVSGITNLGLSTNLDVHTSATISFTHIIWTGTISSSLDASGRSFTLDMDRPLTSGTSISTIVAGTTVTLSENGGNTNGEVTINGTMNLAGFTLSSPSGFTTGSSSTLNGPGTVTITSASATINAACTVTNAPSFAFTITQATGRTFAGASKTYGTLTRTAGSTGTGALTITGTNTFSAIIDTGTVNAHSWVFPNVTTTLTGSSPFQVNGAAGKLVTLARTGGSGTFTLRATTALVINTVDYISVSNSTVDDVPNWFAGANSTNGGNNTNWIFHAEARLKKSMMVL